MLPTIEEGRTVLITSSVVFVVPSTEQLLAMKLSRFAGQGDTSDARILLQRLQRSCSTVEDVWNLVGGLVLVAERPQARHNLDVLWDGQ